MIRSIFHLGLSSGAMARLWDHHAHWREPHLHSEPANFPEPLSRWKLNPLNINCASTCDVQIQAKHWCFSGTFCSQLQWLAITRPRPQAFGPGQWSEDACLFLTATGWPSIAHEIKCMLPLENLLANHLHGKYSGYALRAPTIPDSSFVQFCPWTAATITLYNRRQSLKTA